MLPDMVLVSNHEQALLDPLVAIGGQEQEGIMRNASVLSIVSLLRLLRTPRVAKLMWLMPELMIMVLSCSFPQRDGVASAK